jgi:hypothetical protein
LRRPTVPPSPADLAWKRLNARGDARIYQGHDADGRACPVVLWWPRGQTGNPFCQRNFAGGTLEAALIAAEEATRPPWRSIESLASWREMERSRANRKLARVTADAEFAP